MIKVKKFTISDKILVGHLVASAALLTNILGNNTKYYSILNIRRN